MTDHETGDSTLVAAALAGDDDAFATLVRRHAGAVYKFVYGYVRVGADAEDITQEAFVRTWRNLKRYDASKKFKTWLFAIAKNAALDAIKKKKPFLFSQIAAEEEALEALLAPHRIPAELPGEAFDRDMVREDLTHMLHALPPAYRTVLTMRYHESLKFREIAQALGEPIDTVKSRHRRGLLLLRKMMADQPAETGFV
jgi:RNA polymerase sigma-70 factor, ECF subfamily